MSDFKFSSTDGLEDLLHSTLGTDLIIPMDEKDCIRYFHNGDTMVINIMTGEIFWDAITPGEMTHSKLSFRLHQWFGKGLIKVTKE